MATEDHSVAGPAGGAAGFVAKLINVRTGELAAAFAAFFYILSLMAAYNLLRPVRDAMGIASGVENLPWLFTATFLAMLAATPVYGWLCSRFRRATFLLWVYVFFALNLVAFYLVFQSDPDNAVVARVFFVWLSVFNLFVISVFWSFMADLFSSEQAQRVFGFLAGGASAGAILGPAFTVVMAERLGVANLLLVSAALLTVAVFLIRYLSRWSRVSEASVARSLTPEAPEKPIGGNPIAGFLVLARSPYLLSIGAFIVLYTSVSTFVYLQQAELVRDAFAETADRTQFFAAIDLVVNSLAIFTQVFLTGRIVSRVGVLIALVALPVLMVGGFLTLAAAPTLAVLAVVQVVRRAGNYAITRPAREMLYTVVDRESKYKVKNVIDTVIYRGSDAVNAWFFAALGAIGLALAGTAVVGSVVAAVWAAIAVVAGRMYRRRKENQPGPAGRPVAVAAPVPADQHG